LLQSAIPSAARKGWPTAGIEFDARKFEFIGASISDHVVCALTKASGITSIDK